MIPVAKPFLGEEEAAAVREVILSGWVTQGPKVKEFEENFAAYVGAKYACAVSSCTAALHLALLGAGVRPGDVVITVSHSFIATANAIRHCGAEPVFVDIDPDTYNMNPAEIEKCLAEDCEERNGHYFYNNVMQLAVGESPLCNLSEPKGRVGAILAVHQMGIPCDLGKILKIAKCYRLPVVEDAACAIGSEISQDCGRTWEKIGKPHGEVACFSFHPRKILTTGDGGMLTTNDPEMDQKFRLWRQHGMSISDTLRHGANKVVFEQYETTGFNYRLTDIQAAVGLEQLKRLDSLITERRFLAKTYEKKIEDIFWLEPLKNIKFVKPNWQSFPVKLSVGAPGQRQIMQHLLDLHISSRRGIMNCHQTKAYQDVGWVLPQSENVRDYSILLPFYNGMDLGHVKNIINTLCELTL